MISSKKIEQRIGAIPFVVVLFVMASMGVFSHALAATSPAAVQLPSDLVVVGTMSIQNATITKQVANTFTVDFDLVNQTGAQPGLKYGILLLQQSGGLQSAIDTEVYSNVVSLTENDSEHITATYTAPDFLSGTYLLAVQVKTEDGFPMGTVTLGPVTLHGSGQYVSVDGSSCYLTIPQDTTATHYSIGQGVDLLPSEDLIAHCDVTNTSNVAMTVTPTFTTYYRSVFGAIVSSSTQNPITLAPGEATLETLTIPKATNPQAYDTVLTFLDTQGNQISNSITFHYVIHGPSATIQNVVFDKDAYQPGDTANLSFFWTGSADGFLGSRLGATNEGALTVNIQMTNAQGVSCANDYSEPLDEQSEEVVVAIPVTAPCINPVANVTLSDAAGDVLASSSLLVQTKTNQAQGWPPAAEWALWIVLLIIVVLCLAFLFRGKGGSAKVMGLLIIFGSLVAASIGGITTSHAMLAENGVGSPVGEELELKVKPIPIPTYYACVNNACAEVSGSGTNQCSTLGASCNSASISTSTYLACSNDSCVSVPGNSQNEGGCVNVGDSCNSASEGIAAIAFDVSLDNSQYAPNGTIVGSGDFDYILCDNGSELGANDLEMDMTINGVTEPIVTYNNSTWDVPYEGSPLASGSNDFTAQSTPGTYSAAFTLTAQWDDVGGSNYQATQSGSIPYQVVSSSGGSSASSTLTGTITMTSENSVLPSVGVGAQWDIVDGVNDVCSTSGIPCQGTTETYPNQPAVGDAGVADAGTVDMLNSSISLLNGSSPYALKSIQLAPIAQKQGGLINTMLSLTKSVFGSTAEAFTIPPANPLAQTLSPGSTAAFVILWNPIANIAVSPAAMPLTAAAGGTASGQVQVSNTGAPGSTLTWSSSIAYTNGSGWLSVSPASDATGLTNGASGNASENATITANAAGLAVGTYTGTVTFTGDSTVWPSPGPLVNTVTVTFTVTGIGGSGYDCANNACSSVGSGAQYGSVASCDAACGFSGSVSGMTVSCNPSSIYTNGTSTCTATVDGSGGYSSGVIWSATAGTIDQSGNYTGPGTTGTVTVTATSEQDPTQSGQTEITVNTAPPPTCNGANCQAVCSSPTLTASPSSIVVPESSSLTYGCSNVTQCTLTGGGLDETQTLPTPGTITGSATTTPSMTTTYTLTCVNGDYSSDSTNASVQVVVGGSSLCEQNPNGAGCSGQ